MGNITFKDFKKMDVRIGTVVKAEIPNWSHWVIKLTVDFRPEDDQPLAEGEEIGQRTIFAGVLGFYEPKDLKGKQFPFITNLEPKKIGPEGDYSEGMMLAGVIDVKDDPTSLNLPAGKAELRGASEKPVLLTPVEKVPNGTKVS